MIEKNNSKILPLIPLRDIVVFPNMVSPLFIDINERNKLSSAALFELKRNEYIFNKTI